jgi:hypothetical protein
LTKTLKGEMDYKRMILSLILAGNVVIGYSQNDCLAHLTGQVKQLKEKLNSRGVDTILYYENGFGSWGVILWKHSHRCFSQRIDYTNLRVVTNYHEIIKKEAVIKKKKRFNPYLVDYYLDEMSKAGLKASHPDFPVKTDSGEYKSGDHIFRAPIDISIPDWTGNVICQFGTQIHCFDAIGDFGRLKDKF